MDTSIWIAHFRKVSSISDHFRMLVRRDEVALPIPARHEFLAGIPARRFTEVRGYLDAFELLVPAQRTWNLIDQWAHLSATRGERFGLGDLLIAALAVEHSLLVWSLDNDFERMESLGFCRIYRPGQTAAS